MSLWIRYVWYHYFRPHYTKGHEWQMLYLLNKERKRYRLAPLRMEADLRVVARTHSKDMALQNYFSHTNTVQQSPGDRITSAGITDAHTGENLAFVQHSPTPTMDAMDGLMKSPGHRANILEPSYNGVGIGLYIGTSNRWYYTQNFVRRIFAPLPLPTYHPLRKPLHIKARQLYTPPTPVLLRITQGDHLLAEHRSSHTHLHYTHTFAAPGRYTIQCFAINGNTASLINQHTIHLYRRWHHRLFALLGF